jgi:DNA-directed RNA polymerase sigma subunit (sigma70/sigma32)
VGLTGGVASGKSTVSAILTELGAVVIDADQIAREVVEPGTEGLRRVVEELNQVGSARRTLERQLGREPDPQEIAAELGMDVDRVLDLMSWGRDHVSLDTPVDEDGDTSLGDLMAQETAPGPDLTVLDVEARERLDALVDTLDERAADIIRSRYGLTDGRQHKLADIGAKHGISAERVRQLEREALQKLRRLGDPDLAA